MLKWLRSGDSADPLRELGEAYELPQFPQATLGALQVLRDDEAPLDAVLESLRVDPGLSVRVLRLVNSPGFGLRQPVEELSQAVQMLGRSGLETMLIAAGVRQALPGATSEGFDARAFWTAAAERAVLARGLSSLLCPSQAGRAFTAGLLQDMAVPLIAERKGAAYRELLDRWREGAAPLHALEREAFGWSHADVGQRLCEAWGLPEVLATDIGSHHDDPEQTPELPLSLRLAALCGEPGRGEAELVEAAVDAGLDRDQVTALLESCAEEAAELARMLG